MQKYERVISQSKCRNYFGTRCRSDTIFFVLVLTENIVGKVTFCLLVRTCFDIMMETNDCIVSLTTSIRPSDLYSILDSKWNEIRYRESFSLGQD